MTLSLRPVALGTAALMLVPTLSTAAPEEQDRAVRLNVAGTYETGVFDASAAEITAFDPGTGRLFVVNADSGTIDVLDTQAVLDGQTGAGALLESLDTAGRVTADDVTLPAGTVVNSVDVFDGTLAVAVETPDKVSLGWVLFFDTDGTYRTGVEVGSLPDMVTFTPDGRRVVVANEGEPDDDFASDPEGTVAVIDVSALDALTQDDVSIARFTAYEGARLPVGVRVFGPDVPVPTGQEAAGRVARNLEPEYVAVSADSSTAWVSLQENNAIATIDLDSSAVVDLWAIPGKDHSLPDNGLDPSNRDGAIAINTWPITGMSQPDGITTYDVGGQPLIVTANEGDAREWGDYEEGVRLGDEDYELCESAFGGAEAVAALKEDRALGRLNVTTEQGLTDAGCYDEIFSFGARSFSILTPDGSVVFDSADLMEQTIARLIAEGDLAESAFNATNDETPSFDNRSDDKGPEPESVAVGRIGMQTFAFVTLERIGGVMVFDITDPTNVQFNTYLNNRDFSVAVDGDAAPGMGDLGAEGIEFISASASPTGEPLIAVANEVSGTTTLFDVSTVAPERIGGVDRYDTAAQIAGEFGADVPVAYIASGENFPDALVGAALAGSGDAPVVLTRANRIPSTSLDALEALDPEAIVVLGGTNAISVSVVDQLDDLAPVTRLAGETRYGTAAAVAAARS
ncbi:MAG: choice-of-anchor I family protein, partial [Ornithinimicrobium sp.]